jgi:hypothetical protein
VTGERRRTNWVAVATIAVPVLMLGGSVVGFGWSLLKETTKISVDVADTKDFFARVENHMCRVEAHDGIATEGDCHQDFHPTNTTTTEQATP